MPYIVTTKRPHWSGRTDVTDPFSSSRRAVATLEEARDTIHLGERGVEPPKDDDLHRQLLALSESGGTVGPLPDGTLIEVERLTWEEVAFDERSEGWPDSLGTDFGAPEAQAAIIAAFNAQETRA